MRMRFQVNEISNRKCPTGRVEREIGQARSEHLVDKQSVENMSDIGIPMCEKQGEVRENNFII